jgi:hypothetical protein
MDEGTCFPDLSFLDFFWPAFELGFGTCNNSGTAEAVFDFKSLRNFLFLPVALFKFFGF